jgi:hypothetical protein
LKPATLNGAVLLASAVALLQTLADPAQTAADPDPDDPDPPGIPARTLLLEPTTLPALPAVPGSGPDAEQFARRLLEDVAARLPREPLTITGEISVRRRRGIVERRLGFEASVNWGARPRTVRYTILDDVGRERERFSVTYPDGGPRIDYATGDPPVASPAPGLFQRVQDTDICWADLTLSFLWWRPDRMAGTEEVKGRACYVLDVLPPDPPAASARGYARVRLWIDAKFRLLMQAQGYDAEQRVVRRLWVKSLKKINERWMVKDMEVESVPAVRRTRIRIHDVRAQGQS